MNSSCCRRSGNRLKAAFVAIVTVGTVGCGEFSLDLESSGDSKSRPSVPVRQAGRTRQSSTVSPEKLAQFELGIDTYRTRDLLGEPARIIGRNPYETFIYTGSDGSEIRIRFEGVAVEITYPLQAQISQAPAQPRQPTVPRTQSQTQSTPQPQPKPAPSTQPDIREGGTRTAQPASQPGRSGPEPQPGRPARRSRTQTLGTPGPRSTPEQQLVRSPGGLGDSEEMSALSSEQVTELVAQLDDQDEDVRWAAVARLSQDASSVPALIEILEGDNQRAMEAAIVTLGYIGNEAREARPALNEINRGRSKRSTKRAARWALDQIRRVPKPAPNPVFPDRTMASPMP